MKGKLISQLRIILKMSHDAVIPTSSTPSVFWFAKASEAMLVIIALAAGARKPQDAARDVHAALPLPSWPA